MQQFEVSRGDRLPVSHSSTYQCSDNLGDGRGMRGNQGSIFGREGNKTAVACVEHLYVLGIV